MPTFYFTGQKFENDRILRKQVEEAHTPQNGIEAVPAWGPASDIKFLTCFTYITAY